MAEPIVSWFGEWPLVGLANYVLDRGAHRCHLTNMIERSVHGSDAYLCQITLTACLYSHYWHSLHSIFVSVCLSQHRPSRQEISIYHCSRQVPQQHGMLIEPCWELRYEAQQKFVVVTYRWQCCMCAWVASWAFRWSRWSFTVSSWGWCCNNTSRRGRRCRWRRRGQGFVCSV